MSNRDTWLEHMENRCGCNDNDLMDEIEADELAREAELEAEDVVLDRLHLELKASWEALRHTNAGKVAR